MKYFYSDNQEFIIENYDQEKAFSSFLPGVAGVMGIPLWAFYANRGQGITSFGVEDKANSIMEFFPANGGYQYVHSTGFRTFIKEVGIETEVYEPFISHPKDLVKRFMGIHRAYFFVEEVNETKGLRVKATYYILPNSPIGGLVRYVEIENLNDNERQLEVVDGMPALLPYGVTTAGYKEVGNLLRSWMEVYHQDSEVLYYKLRASTEDSEEVTAIDRGNYFVAAADSKVIQIADNQLIFGFDKGLVYPEHFANVGFAGIVNAPQVTANKVPCAFALTTMSFTGKEKKAIALCIGHALEWQTAHDFFIGEDVHQRKDLVFYLEKLGESIAIIDEISSPLATVTSQKLVDAYFEQSYLDNILRGGQPLLFGDQESPHVYHVFSRKHGDPERDYNFFSLSAEYYSQGNGNFRDVNQNRRNDILFEPKIGSSNIKTFGSLIQLDGYNPLSVAGSLFELKKETDIESLISAIFSADKTDRLVAFSECFNQLLKKKLTPGLLAKFYEDNKVDLKVGVLVFVNEVLKNCELKIQAAFGEGYWSDHFTYTYDLIETYSKIYPDKMKALLVEDRSYTIFKSPATVRKVSEKIGLTKEGKVRQYGMIDHYHQGQARQNFEGFEVDKHGEVIKTSLLDKLLILVFNKFLLLDQGGMGIEMEGGKPGWNDAMNGLPGLIGSGLSETIELKRIIEFLLTQLESQDKSYLLAETVELHRELELLIALFNEKQDFTPEQDFSFWQKRCQVRESYRERIYENPNFDATPLGHGRILHVLEPMLGYIDKGIRKAEILNQGVIPTYLSYEVVEHKEALEAKKTPYGLKQISMTKVKPRPLPIFLEAPARLLKTLNALEASDLYEKIKTTQLRDSLNHMYKTSVDLSDESMEIGRIVAFTPGWLERESIFLHMTYKYLYGLLQAKAYDVFFEAFKENFIPFLDPSIYGRPTTENSSFIASDVNPDPFVKGQGFVSRLSGSTAETISIWQLLFVGDTWFKMEEESLVFEFKPILPFWMFNEKNEVRFKLFNQVSVIYVNETKKATYGTQSAQIKQISVDGMPIEGTYLKGELAYQLRNKEIKEIKVIFS